jgi:hypothetical protein
VPVVCKVCSSYDNFQHDIEKQRRYTSPCLNPCRVSKDSEQSFCFLTQHVTIVSVALVRGINFVGKVSSDIPT